MALRVQVGFHLLMSGVLNHRFALLLDYLAEKRWRAILVIFALSCGLRFAILGAFLLAGNQLYTGEAENIARSMVLRGVFADPYAIPTGPTAHCAPIYPSIAALIYTVFGLGTVGELARCAVSILAFSALYSLFPWFATRFGFDFRAGIIAGFYAALLPTRRSTEVLGGWETPYAAIVLAVLLAWTLNIIKRDRLSYRGALLWGAAWGAASMLLTSLFAVFGSVCALFLIRRFRPRTIGLLAVAVFACALVLLPWTIRNRVTLGAWMFVRSNLGIELEVGNHPGARPDVEENMAAKLHPSGSPQRALEVRTLGEVEYNHRAMQRALAWIRQNPGAFLSLSAERCFRFWFSTPLHPFEFALTFPVMLFAIWAMVRLWKTNPDSILIWILALLSYSLIYYVTQYSARYRAVVEWMPLIAAGQLWIQRMSSSRKKPALEAASR